MIKKYIYVYVGGEILLAKARWKYDITPELFIKKFKELKSVKEMSFYWGVDRATIRNYAKKIGFNYKDFIPSHNFKQPSEEDIKYICEQYYCKTSKELAEKFGVSKSYIKKIWKKNGLSGKRNKPYTYVFDENYFESIDSKDKAYFLGLLATDGCVYKRKNGIGQHIIKLSLVGDLEIIEEFKKHLKSNNKITKMSNKNKSDFIYTLAIVSDKMAEDLRKYGIVTNKTDKTKFPNIDNEFIPHFIRGVLDGDGSIYKTIQPKNKLKKYRYTINIVGTYKLLNRIAVCLKMYSINSTIYRDNKNYSFPLYTLKIQRQEDMLKFIDLIYKDCDNLYIKRKKDKADELVDDVRCRLAQKCAK